MERASASDDFTASMLAQGTCEGGEITVHGHYTFRCTDSDGKVLWEDGCDNLVTTVGKNLILDQALAGSAYTAADYMGLISSASFSAVAVGDTMSSHAGWLESGVANAPTMSSTRLTAAWSAASAGAKALSAALSFVMTGSGTVQGAFLVGGSGASATVANTSGTLISAGTLTVAQPVVNTNTLQMSYSITLTKGGPEPWQPRPAY